jgi:hypothetical protein
MLRDADTAGAPRAASWYRRRLGSLMNINILVHIILGVHGAHSLRANPVVPRGP